MADRRQWLFPMLLIALGGGGVAASLAGARRQARPTHWRQRHRAGRLRQVVGRPRRSPTLVRAARRTPWAHVRVADPAGFPADRPLGLCVSGATPTRWCPGGLLVTSSTTRLTSRHLVGDPGGDPREHVVRQPRPVGGHGVLAGDRAQHDRVAVGAAVALHADGAHVGEQHDRELPDVAVEAGRGQLLAGDRRRPARRTSSRSRSTAPMIRIARPGPGERVPPDDLRGQAELLRRPRGPRP